MAREAVRQLFLRLVTLGEGTADTRRPGEAVRASALEVDASAMESAIDAYGRHRLLTFDRDPSTENRPSRSRTRRFSARGSGSAAGSTGPART